MLVELAWRVIRYHPNYPPVRRWQEQLSGHVGGRKRAAVAIGRQLAIDLWRMETGRATAQQLKLT